MRFLETPVSGAFIVEVEPQGDDRGHFARTFCAREFAAHGLETVFVQHNAGFSLRKGTLRGLHYQLPPHAEAKLVRCTRGALFDVVVDARPDSPTHLAWLSTELSEDNGRMVYIPRGCAHGYLTLADRTEIAYQTSAFYEPASERGVRWDDPAVGIRWPGEVAVISERDSRWPGLGWGREGATG